MFLFFGFQKAKLAASIPLQYLFVTGRAKGFVDNLFFCTDGVLHGLMGRFTIYT
jgi:hypothetical protein